MKFQVPGEARAILAILKTFFFFSIPLVFALSCRKSPALRAWVPLSYEGSCGVMDGQAVPLRDCPAPLTHLSNLHILAQIARVSPLLGRVDAA